jgi:hypothetical protein
MARETFTERKLMSAIWKACGITDRSNSMFSAQDSTNMARAFLAAEMVMSAANCGGSSAARARAEKALDGFFAQVEQAVHWTKDNPLDRRS